MSSLTSTTANAAEPLEQEIEVLLSQALVECTDCLNRGEFGGALKALDGAIQLAPANPDILNHRARLLVFLKEYDLALADFEKAAQIAPSHVLVNAGLARYHFDQGAHSEAEAFAYRALATDPQNLEAAEVLSGVEKIAGTKSAEARQSIQEYFTNAREEFAGVEPPALSEWHLKNSRVITNRENILERMPKGGVYAEIGTQTGDFARQIMTCLKPAKMHIFDIDFTPFDRAAFQSSIANGTVELHQGDSSAALATLPDRSFDFIYIDGDHAYEGVAKDLAMAAQKIKADGWIVCNDYTIYSPVEKMQYGVYRAVNEFCWREGFEIVFLGLHYWSYHDVALRRMSPDAVASAGQAPKPAKAGHTGMVKLSGRTASLHKPAPIRSSPPRVFLAGETFSSGTNSGIQAPAVPSSPGTNSNLPYDLDAGLELEIGAHSYIHDNKIRNPSGALTNIAIGKFCCVASGLSVIGYDHHSEWAAMYPFLDDGHRANWPGTDGIPYPQSPEFGSNKSRGDITIGNEVWIGSDVKLFKGITVGDGAVIGACSLVNKSVDPYTVVAGIPARPIRKRFSDQEIKLLQKIQWWDLPEALINRHMGLLCSSNIVELEHALESDPEFQNFKQGIGATTASNKVRHLAQRANPAPPMDIIETIGHGDEMFTGDRGHYFGVGKSALHGIETALSAAHQPRTKILSVLDLPCGHGRVMRHLKAAFPHAQITACDLNRGAVDFCAQTFGALPVYSKVNVDQIALPGNYDLIWSGSLLTHLRPGACAEFIRLWNSLINPGGLIVFTLHGRWVERSLATRRYTYGLKEHDVVSLLKEYYETGFGYADYPGQSGYGISVSSPSYVLSKLVSLPDLKLISYHEKGWDNHQDIVCLQKQPANEPLG